MCYWSREGRQWSQHTHIQSLSEVRNYILLESYMYLKDQGCTWKRFGLWVNDLLCLLSTSKQYWFRHVNFTWACIDFALWRRNSKYRELIGSVINSWCVQLADQNSDKTETLYFVKHTHFHCTEKEEMNTKYKENVVNRESADVDFRNIYVLYW